MNMYRCICMYVHVYICMFIYMCMYLVCIHICIYAYNTNGYLVSTCVCKQVNRPAVPLDPQVYSAISFDL